MCFWTEQKQHEQRWLFCRGYISELCGVITYMKLYIFVVCKANFKEDNQDWVSVCLCLSLASDSSETIKVIIIKFGTVTASDMIMHHVLIILTLTFIQGHRYYTKYSIISKSVQAMSIMFAVKRVWLKVYLFLVWWPWPSRLHLCLKLDKRFNLYFNSNISENI